MESYIVRIYRRTEDGPQDIAGIVEEVETQTTKPFKSSGELVRLLKNEKDVAKCKDTGKTGN